MLTGPITGIDPFVNWSTFKGPTLTIPRGLFYGGIFYTSEEYTPPCHISYIMGRDEVCLSTWGIADALGKELAQIYFYDEDSAEGSDPALDTWGPNVGHIIDINGNYAGCLKGQLYHYIDPDAVDPEPSDLLVFLNNLRGEHILDSDSLILDICACGAIPKGGNNSATLNTIALPQDYELAQDDNQRYYIKKAADAENLQPVKSLTFTATTPGPGVASATISGANLVIAPWTMPTVVSGGTIVDGHSFITYEAKETDVGSDIGITAVDGGIVIGRRGRLNELSK